MGVGIGLSSQVTRVVPSHLTKLFGSAGSVTGVTVVPTTVGGSGGTKSAHCWTIGEARQAAFALAPTPVDVSVEVLATTSPDGTCQEAAHVERELSLHANFAVVLAIALLQFGNLKSLLGFKSQLPHKPSTFLWNFALLTDG